MQMAAGVKVGATQYLGTGGWVHSKIPGVGTVNISEMVR